MLDVIFSFMKASSRIGKAEDANIGLVVFELVIAVILLALLFLVRKRFLKIMCICGSEICLFLACKMFFGEDSIITMIMCWITAAAACVVTVAIVNRIDWKNLRGKNDF